MTPLLEYIYQGVLDEMDQNIRNLIKEGAPAQNLIRVREALHKMREERDKFRDAGVAEPAEAP